VKRGIAALAATVVLVVPTLADATHPRPKSASPVTASLVPAYEQCTAPDRTHGPPLAFPSCSGPQQVSDYLTVGNPPPAAAQYTGFVRVKANAGLPGPPDDNVVSFSVDTADVRCQGVSGACTAAGADYAGSLRLQLTVRATDHWNCADACEFGGPDPATVQDFTIEMTVPCVQTSDPAIGSSCQRREQHWNLFPCCQYPIRDDKRTIYEIGPARVYDGGADGDGSTTGDNTLFAVQGIFIP
jgi:hypothetical protein